MALEKAPCGAFCAVDSLVIAFSEEIAVNSGAFVVRVNDDFPDMLTRERVEVREWHMVVSPVAVCLGVIL